MKIQPGTCKFSSEAHKLATAWRKAGEADGKDRDRLAELAKRVALISSSMNQDSEVGVDSMQAALLFMGWQETIRSVYQPSEALTMEAKISELILNGSKVGVAVKWSRFARNKNLYKKYGARMVASARDGLIKEGLLKYDSATGTITRV